MNNQNPQVVFDWHPLICYMLLLLKFKPTTPIMISAILAILIKLMDSLKYTIAINAVPGPTIPVQIA